MICANRRSKVIFGKPLAPYIGRLLFERGRRSAPSGAQIALCEMILLVGMTAAPGCFVVGRAGVLGEMGFAEAQRARSRLAAPAPAQHRGGRDRRDH